jgi:hypothetical protein
MSSEDKADADAAPEPEAEAEPEAEHEAEPEPFGFPLGNNGNPNHIGVDGTHNGIPWGWGATSPYIAPSSVFDWDD